MEEDMIMNVPSAPEMQGTPMASDLSGQMQPEMGEVSQSEMQEAQGALMQIIQVINMLIEQGLNEEQVKAFLEQYGISEDELDQAAQALGVDIDAILSGQMQQPQEPMMMAEGGPGVLPDNEPTFQNRSPQEQIFTLQNAIDNLYTEYEMVLRNNEVERAQNIVKQINDLDNQIIQIKANMPTNVGAGLGQKKN